ncbi:MAG: hypothetical protein J3K34DRAFT_488153 [Monoraphidium minutum]|nr:MAG: hypothetical protein J3K34DRAFT_488153 [Monoraphidium minutum]
MKASQLRAVDRQQHTSATTPRRTAIGLLVAAAAGAVAPQPAAARIQTEEPMLRQRQAGAPLATGGFDPSDVPAARPAPPARGAPPGEPSGRGADPRAHAAVQDALARLAAARAAAAAAEWRDALREFSGLVEAHPDMALATYGRIGRAEMLYQARACVGEVSNAIVLLDELEVTDRGTPEVHAALAAVLWAERPSQRLRAEQQFEIATEFDRRYSDAAYARDVRHWPPRLVAALERFLRLEG